MMKGLMVLCLTGMTSFAFAATSTGMTKDNTNPAETFSAGRVISCASDHNNDDAHCCSLDESGSKRSAQQCTSDGNELAIAKKHGLAIYLGKVCSPSKVTCKNPRLVYCVFTDEVTYRIQTAGRKQLGIGFGTAASPDCGGFTTEQMKKIDLNKINFGYQPYQSIF